MIKVGLEKGGEVFEGHPLPFPFALDIVSGSRIAWFLDDSHQHLTQTVEALILQVVLHQRTLFFFREPIALTLADLQHQLGIELVVLHRCLKVDVAVDRYADEATRTRRVCQRHLLIGGADERGIAAV